MRRWQVWVSAIVTIVWACQAIASAAPDPPKRTSPTLPNGPTSAVPFSESPKTDDDPSAPPERSAAEHGDADAQYAIGTRYSNGDGVPKDDTQAVVWWRRAAEQRLPEAEVALAEAYHQGSGVTKDFDRALAWFRQAAEQGDAQAENNLGFMYQNGEGVPRDPAAAVRWWRRAAEGGNVSALYNLAVAYRNGDGVEHDNVEAFKWVQIAEDHAAEARREKYAILHTTLAAELTSTDIVDARERIRVWNETFGRNLPNPKP